MDTMHTIMSCHGYHHSSHNWWQKLFESCKRLQPFVSRGNSKYYIVAWYVTRVVAWDQCIGHQTRLLCLLSLSSLMSAEQTHRWHPPKDVTLSYPHDLHLKYESLLRMVKHLSLGRIRGHLCRRSTAIRHVSVRIIRILT